MYTSGNTQGSIYSTLIEMYQMVKKGALNLTRYANSRSRIMPLQDDVKSLFVSFCLGRNVQATDFLIIVVHLAIV